MKISVRKMIIPLGIILISAAVFFISLAITSSAKPDELPVYNTTVENGVQLLTSSITDIKDCHVFKAVNRIPDSFVSVSSPETTPDGDSGSFERGSYQFLITNLDPLDPEFSQKAEALDFLSDVDGNWHLTMYIPPVLSACNVYVRVQLRGVSGAIYDYDYSAFYNSGDHTYEHRNATSPMFLDLTLYSDRKFLSIDSPANNGILVTIHCEAEEGKEAVIDGDILIGEDSAVRRAVGRNNDALSFLSMICIAILAVLVFVSALKRSSSFVPLIFLVVGVMGSFFCAHRYTGTCVAPYWIKSLGACFTGVIAIGGALSGCGKVGRFSVKYTLVSLSAVFCALLFMAEILPHDKTAAVKIAVQILGALLATGIALSGLISSCNETVRGFGMECAVCAVIVAAAASGQFGLSLYSPMFVMFIILLATVIYTSFREFVVTEKRNLYLTANLQSEVERQTADLKAIINERDSLLRFLSHDLKKPVTRMEQLLNDVKNTSDENRRSDAIENIAAKLRVMDSDITEIQHFSKTTYTAEKSDVTELEPLLSRIFTELEPDCAANGIILRYHPASIRVFAKPKLLESVLRNLIFNALDHAECSVIVMEAHRYKSICRITVSDNGKGISSPQNIFEPYESGEKNSENLGLGLYICRRHLASMGGNLTYERISGNTVFTVTLPLT